MGFLDSGGVPAQSFANSFLKALQAGQQHKLEREKLLLAQQQAAEQAKVQAAQIQNYQAMAAENQAQAAARQRAEQQQTAFQTGYTNLYAPTEQPAPISDEGPNPPQMVPGNPTAEQRMAFTRPFLTPQQAMQADVTMTGQENKLSPILAQLIRSAQDGTLGPQGIAILEKMGYGGVFSAKQGPLIAGVGPDGKPTSVVDAPGVTRYEKPADNETWSKPYEETIGGKKALVQASSRGQIRTVLQDTSTTTNVNMQTPSTEEVEVVAQLLADGKITMSDISKRGGVKQQAAILKRASELNPSIDPRADQAATSAFASSMTMQQRQLGMMGSFVKNMDYQVSRVKELGEELKTFDSRIMNVPLRAVRGKIAGSALQAKYDMYITEIENEIGKLATGSAASISELSVGAQEKWAKIHDKNLSVKDMISLLEETSKAGKMRMKSVQDQLSETKTQMRGRGAVAAPAPESSGPMTALPPAASAKGRTIRRSDGIRLQSDGTKWNIVR